MKIKLLFLLLFIITNYSFAQVKEFGDISQEEWEIKVCDFDSLAKIIILFDVGKVKICPKHLGENHDEECQLKTEYYQIEFSRHLRIKILDTLGLETKRVTFNLNTKNNSTDKIYIFRSVISWMENGKVNSSKFKSKALVKEINNEGNYKMSFNFPIIKSESIIDIEYIILSDNFDDLPIWNFQNELSTIYRKFNLVKPDFFVYQNKCDILSLLTSNNSSEETSYTVSVVSTDGNQHFKDYKYNITNESYKLFNTKGISNSDTKGQLTYTLKSNNIQSVFGKKTSLILYRR